MIVRNARAEDYAAFVRLFPELAVPDPIMSEERFASELVPTTLIAESSGDVSGYIFFQIMGTTAYVRHVVVAPSTRRRGVGSMLMQAVAERARAAQCERWCLNVKPDNVAAIGLYEAQGMARAFDSRSIVLDWAKVATHFPSASHARARLVEPNDEAAVEDTMKLVPGQLNAARSLPGRVLLMLEESDAIVGGAIFHPHFPGAYPFRVARPDLCWALLEAIRPHAKPGDPRINVVVEGQPALADALISAGGVVTLDALHFVGSLPPAAPARKD